MGEAVQNDVHIEFFSRSEMEVVSAAKMEETRRICKDLGMFAKRIAGILKAHQQSNPALVSCLDDLLGAVYSLFLATRYHYADRQGPLDASNVESVANRAKDMSNYRIRTDGT